MICEKRGAAQPVIERTGPTATPGSLSSSFLVAVVVWFGKVERDAKTARGAGLRRGLVLENVVVGKRETRKTGGAGRNQTQAFHGINTGAGNGCGKVAV